MNLNQLQRLFSSYGTLERNWPSADRPAILMLLQISPAAQALYSEYQSLDQLLELANGTEDYTTEEAAQRALEKRIMSRIQPPLIARFIDWLTPDLRLFPNALWRPISAAAATLVLGIAVGINVPADERITEDYSVQNFSDTDAFYYLALTEDSIGGFVNEKP